MPKRIIIAAQSLNRVIGKNNDLPWHLPLDFKFFKESTRGHAVVMGRNTYESLNGALPNRLNIVVSRQKGLAYPDAEVCHDLDEAFTLARQRHEKVFIIGGAQIYETAIDEVDQLLITWVHTELEGDTFFPAINPAIWQQTDQQFVGKDDKNAYDMTFSKYERRS